MAKVHNELTLFRAELYTPEQIERHLAIAGKDKLLCIGR